MAKKDCFLVAARFALDNKDWLVCHGIATGQGKIKGRLFGHAWNEKGDIVLDQSNGQKTCITKKRYYEMGKIDSSKVKRYSQKEAAELMIKHCHFGPWEEL